MAVDEQDVSPGQKLYRQWELLKQAETRMGLAAQTFEGAKAEYASRYERLTGAIEFVAGGPAEWHVNQQAKTIEWVLNVQKGRGETTDVLDGASGSPVK